MNVNRVKSWLLSEQEIVASTAAAASGTIASLSEVLVMVAMPLVPAVLSGLSLYFALLSLPDPWPEWSVLLLAVLVVVALEPYGIASSKTAVRFYQAQRDGEASPLEAYATATTVVLYVVLIVGINLLSHSLPLPLIGLGAVSPVLSAAAYVVIGLNNDLQRRLDRRATTIQRRDDFQDERELMELEDERERMEMDREFKKEKHAQSLELRRLREEAKLRSKEAALTSTIQEADSLLGALEIVRHNPNISGAQLGRQLGLSSRQGRRVLAQVTEELQNG